MEEKKVFVRKATGLVREIGMLTGVIIVMAHVVGLGWQKRVFQTIGWLPIKETLYWGGLPPLFWAFVACGIVVLLNIFCWSAMGASMPRAGGGYVYVSRIVNPTLGFVTGWSMFMADVIAYGLIAAACVEALYLFGMVAGIAVPLTSFLIFGTGLLVILIFSAVAVFGTKPLVAFMHIIFWIPVVVTILMIAVLLGVTPEAMEAGIRAITGHGAIEYTRAALAQGMREVAAPYGMMEAIGVGSIGAYWAYIGYTATTYVAGEVKEAYKSLPKILFTAGLLIIFLYLLVPTLGARACMMAGREAEYSFLSSWGFLSYGKGSLAAAGLPGIKGWIPIAGALASEGMGLWWMKYLLVFFGVLWPANDIPPFIFVCSRIIFAMSFDRVLPETLAAVSARFYSPINAIVFVGLFSILGVLAESDIFAPPPWGIGVPWLFTWVNSGSGICATDLWDVICFFFASIAAILFVFRRRDIYEKSPFKIPIAGVPLITIMGVLALFGNLWLMHVIIFSPYSAMNPAYPEGVISIAVTVGFIILGLIIYWAYRARGRAIGVDYSTVYAEIPPE
ncbi:MAG: putative fructoselysine transporter [Candidatus Bathyarchaeota archaeon BA1]|nr:MAG: putative fructoselysine transporter [Candidatus Bathyarchaeota archaeon BA1]